MQIQAVALAALQRANADFSRAAQAVSQAAAASAGAAGGDLLSLSAAAVELLQSRTAFEAALAVAETADDIARESLDVLA